jgi:hypothetical protein
MNLGSTTMKTSNQLDGANDDVMSSNNTKKPRTKKLKIIQIEFQLDGTGPPVSYLISHYKIYYLHFL